MSEPDSNKIPGRVLCLMLAAWALRLVDLARFPVWEDEAATWWFALRVTEGTDLVERMRAEPTPPLHYGLIGVLLRLFGDSDFVLRFPSTVLGALGVGAVFVLGRAVLNERIGWWAALWLAVHPWHVAFSREARAYTLLALGTVFVAWSLWRALEQPTLTRCVLLTFSLTLACWTHFYGLFLGFTVGICILIWGRSWKDRFKLLSAAAVAGVLFAPYVALVLPGLQAGGSDWSVHRLYEISSAASHPVVIAEGHAIGAQRTPFARRLSQPPTPSLLQRPAVLAQALLVLLGWAALFTATPLLAVAPLGYRRRLYLLVFGLLPVLVPWLISVIHRPIFHLGRHDFFVLPIVALWIGAGFEVLISGFGRAERRRLGKIIAGLLVIAVLPAALFRLAWLHLLPTPSEPRALAVHLAEQVPEDGLIVATGIRRLSLERYLRPAGSTARIESFPSSTDDHPGWADPRDLIRRQDELRLEAEKRVAAWAAENRKVWVLPRAYPESPEDRRRSEEWLIDRHLFEALEQAGFHLAHGQGTGNGSYERFERRP